MSEVAEVESPHPSGKKTNFNTKGNNKRNSNKGTYWKTFDHDESIFSGQSASDKMEAGTLADYPALRILEPARQKLVNIDTLRIMWCLDECIKHLEVVTSLLLVVLRSKDKAVSIQNTLGVEATADLQSFKKSLEKMMKNLNHPTNSLPQAELEGKVCEECKKMLRSFMKNEDAVKEAVGLIPENIAIVGGRKFHQPKRLLRAMKELREQMYDRLLTTPIEVKERTRHLQMVAKNDKINNETIEKLEQELADAIRFKEEEVEKKNNTIKKLKNDLYQIESFSTESIKLMKQESEAQANNDRKDSEAKLAKLNQDFETASKVFDKMVDQHRDNEQKIRKKKSKIEQECENWIAKYDVEMAEKQDEYEEIDAVYTEEKKRLNELEEKFAVLSEEYNKIIEERRLVREKKEAEEAEFIARTDAATFIQAHFRAWRVRKVLKRMRKKMGLDNPPA